ncbi:hypothetical protein FPOAC2_01234 [Fusarium poae]
MEISPAQSEDKADSGPLPDSDMEDSGVVMGGDVTGKDELRHHPDLGEMGRFW